MLELELSPSSISQITQMSSIVASGAKIWSRRKEQAVSRRIVEARASEEQAVTSSEDGVGQKEEPRAHLVAHRVEKYVIEEMQKPLGEILHPSIDRVREGGVISGDKIADGNHMCTLCSRLHVPAC